MHFAFVDEGANVEGGDRRVSADVQFHVETVEVGAGKVYHEGQGLKAVGWQVEGKCNVRPADHVAFGPLCTVHQPILKAQTAMSGVH